jgi:hypothetical protein
MKTTVRFLRHAGVYRPMCDLFESLTRSAAFRSGPGQTFRTHRKLLRPTHRRDEPRPAIPQRVARQHCPSLLHRHAHPKSVPGSGTINLQRTVNSVLTVCLSPGDNPKRQRRIQQGESAPPHSSDLHGLQRKTDRGCISLRTTATDRIRSHSRW